MTLLGRGVAAATSPGGTPGGGLGSLGIPSPVPAAGQKSWAGEGPVAVSVAHLQQRGLEVMGNVAGSVIHLQQRPQAICLGSDVL